MLLLNIVDRDTAHNLLKQAEGSGVDRIVIPNCYDTLEWIFKGPIPHHTFLEPPMIVTCTNNAGCVFMNESYAEGH